MFEEVKTIFFDMGGTLIDFHTTKSDYEKDQIGMKKMHEFLITFNPKLTLKSIETNFYIPMLKALEVRKTSPLEIPVENYLDPFLNLESIQLSSVEKEKLMENFYSAYLEYAKIEENLQKTLQIIKNAGFSLGIISNTFLYPVIYEKSFKYLGIFDFFNSFTFSYSVGARKPQPKIFKIALASLNMESQNSLMIGDKIAKDVEPAINMGMSAIWYNPKSKLRQNFTYNIAEIARIDEILQILKLI